MLRACERHGFDTRKAELAAGRGGTFPTFICGELAIKFYGHLPSWERAYAAERAASECAATDPHVLSPAVLAHGRLAEDPVSPWPYVITRLIAGKTWQEAALSTTVKRALAADLGRQVRRIHALEPATGVATPETWSARGVTEAALHSVLPRHWALQADNWVARVEAADSVFVHGDLMFRHVFVADGRLAGIIDWGDALITDRQYELAQIQLSLFDGDKSLLRTFLEHSHWPVDRDFAHRALAQAFHRQAIGLAQHRPMDVFHKLPGLLPLEEFETLDELADALFGL